MTPWQPASKASFDAAYRVDFFDEDGNLFSTVELHEADDAAAIQHAHRINVPSGGGWFQVLHGTRLVYTHRNPPLRGTSVKRLLRLRHRR